MGTGMQASSPAKIGMIASIIRAPVIDRVLGFIVASTFNVQLFHGCQITAAGVQSPEDTLMKG
jgi:hypothetical protein